MRTIAAAYYPPNQEWLTGAKATPFTREPMHADGLLEERWVVDDASRLAQAVAELMVDFGN